MLTAEQITRFATDGFVHVPGAFPREVADRCVDEMWELIDPERDDPATWTEPVIRIEGLGTEPFRAAATTPALHEAFDQLVGPGRWVPRDGLGTIPIRFPVDAPPGDDGWHVEASSTGPDGRFRVGPSSPGRRLLMLFLFTDVGPDDAPTRLRAGSHRDVPPFLAGVDDDGPWAGRDWWELCCAVDPATAHHPTALATGAAGDVYLCHPFVVHAAQPHRGTTPRFMAQPPLRPA